MNPKGNNVMHTIRTMEKADKDGALLLRIPLGTPGAEYDVVVVFQPKESSEVRGWPPDYFKNTFGSIDDDTFFRHPQGELPMPVELE